MYKYIYICVIDCICTGVCTYIQICPNMYECFLCSPCDSWFGTCSSQSQGFLKWAVGLALESHDLRGRFALPDNGITENFPSVVLMN